MAQTYDTQELKDLASAVAHTAMAFEGIMADGKVDVRDLARIPQIFAAIKEFTDVSFAKLIPEAKSLSAESLADLHAHFTTVFDLDNDTVENAVEQVLAAIEVVVGAFQSIRSVAAVVKKAVTPAA